MLQTDVVYTVSQIEPRSRVGSPAHDSTAAWIEAQRHTPATVHGAWLANAGLPLPRMKAEVATIFHLQPHRP
jgi:uncharacterized lipoprotein YddW (UPF0748 family)